MNLQQLPSWNVALPLALWLVVLALLPWWLGLSLLLAAVAVLLLQGSHLVEHHAIALRRALRWGLPGMLLALQRALGGGALAWAIALLGALAGYMLIVGLEAWLDRAATRDPGAVVSMSMSAPEVEPLADPATEWPARVMSSALGPPAEIIALELPQWHTATGDLPDPWGHQVQYQNAGYEFAAGRRMEGVAAGGCFSPDGRWFAAHLAHAHGVLLWDRRADRVHHLRGWQLAGWYREQPWLQRNPDAAPCALQHVLGADDGEEESAAR